MNGNEITMAEMPESTLDGAAQALRVLVVFVVVVAVWEAARSLNAGLMSAGLVTARAFIAGMADLFQGAAPLQQKLAHIWSARADVVCSLVLLPAVLALSARLLAMGTVLDYLYVDSPCASERGMGGLLASGAVMLLHAGGIYAMASWSAGGRHDLVPAGFVIVCIAGLVSAAGVTLSTRGDERRRLCRVKYLCLTSGAAAVGVVVALNGAPAVHGPVISCATAAIALGLCLADAYIHVRRPPSQDERLRIEN